MLLEQNIQGLCKKFGIHFDDFKLDMEIDHVGELTLHDLEAICEEYEVDLHAMLFKPMFQPMHLKEKLQKIRCLVLDVDGVMTDGGMYFTEQGDQFKKYNTKDGMALLEIGRLGMEVAIISSGFTQEMVQARANMLGIKHCFVTREPKLEVMKTLCHDLGIELEHVAVIGDDINDLEIIKASGISACPIDAVEDVKKHAQIILTKKGGRGCVREFVDNYLMAKRVQL
jgi:YrbI family 3-deoxy-D-manno-octulosonate 8-phosphate phosphatase